MNVVGIFFVVCNEPDDLFVKLVSLVQVVHRFQFFVTLYLLLAPSTPVIYIKESDTMMTVIPWAIQF